MEIKEECVEKHISKKEIDLLRFNCVEVLRILSLIDLRDGKFTAMYRDENGKVKDSQLFFYFNNALLDLLITSKHMEAKLLDVISDAANSNV